MKIRHYNGTVVDVAEDKARSMVSGGSWVYHTKRDQKAHREPETETVVEPTPEPVEVVEEPSEGQEEAPEPKVEPTIPEMREWGLKNNIEGAKPQGKLAKAVIDAYKEAHKE